MQSSVLILVCERVKGKERTILGNNNSSNVFSRTQRDERRTSVSVSRCVHRSEKIGAGTRTMFQYRTYKEGVAIKHINFFFYFRKCMDDSLAKKVWGQGLGWNMFKNDLMSNCPQVTHTKISLHVVYSFISKCIYLESYNHNTY